MSRPGVGNPGNSGGKKGRSGRPSAYKERQNAEWHNQIWEAEQDVHALEDRLRSGFYAGRDMAALRLLKGDKVILAKFMDKLMPDAPKAIDVTSGGEKLPTPILNILKSQDDV